MTRLLAATAALVVSAACAAQHAPGATARLFIRGDPQAPAPPGPFDDPGSAPSQPPVDRPEAARRAAEAIAAATPSAQPDVPTLEGEDRVLAAALLDLERGPTAPRHRAAGDAYRRAGVLDKAHEHYTAAIRLDPADAVSWDARARIWRDWGFPNLGLPDARRAVYFAPSSAEAANTLGTIHYVLGQPDAALLAFERAASLAPGAAWARRNLCRVLAELGQDGARFGCTPGTVPPDRGPTPGDDR